MPQDWICADAGNQIPPTISTIIAIRPAALIVVFALIIFIPNSGLARAIKKLANAHCAARLNFHEQRRSQISASVNIISSIRGRIHGRYRQREYDKNSRRMSTVMAWTLLWRSAQRGLERISKEPITNINFLRHGQVFSFGMPPEDSVRPQAARGAPNCLVPDEYYVEGGAACLRFKQKVCP
jgi:hypothetical protein